MANKRIVVIADIFADMLTQIVAYPQLGDSTNGTPMKRNSGGCGGNIAAGLGVLGVDTHVVCRLGDDENGYFLRDDLAKDGVNTDGLAYDTERSSGTVIITVTPDGERSIWMLTMGSSFEFLTMEDLAYVDKVNPDAVFVSGVLMGSQPVADNILKAMEGWKGKYKIYYDPNLRYPTDAVPPMVAECNRRCSDLSDVVLTGKSEMDALNLKKQPGQIFIVKDGKNGSALLGDDGEYEIVMPVTERKMVDATGAGDAYSAAFTCADMEGMSIRDAMRFATVAAGGAVTRSGARSMPPRAEIEEYLKTWHE